MLEVVISFCLLNAPTRCREVVFEPGEAVTPYQCVMGAQIQASKWLADHPNFNVSKWTCRRARSEAKL